MNAYFGKTDVLMTHHSQTAIFSIHFPWFLIVVACLTRLLNLAALHWLRSPYAIRDANSKQSNTKIYEKTYLLLWISAVIGRYEPHLMIVVIFVTQNNF